MKTTIYTIYKTTFPNNKVYIGMTSKSLDQRRSSHYSLRNISNTLIARAIKKYFGQENWEVLYQTKCNIDILEKEKYFIKLYNSKNPDFGYNLTEGGDGVRGFKHSEEANKANSERKKEYYKNNPEHLEKQINTLRSYYEKNPQARKENAQRQFQSLEYRKEFGKKLKDSYTKKGFNGGKPKIKIKLVKDNIEIIFNSQNEAARYLGVTENAVRQATKSPLRTVKKHRAFRVEV